MSDITLHQRSPASAAAARAWLERELPAEAMRLISVVSSLEEALEGADYVQESASEQLPLKRDLFVRLAEAAPAYCLFASSTSALLPDAIFGALPAANRCLIAHPANPPHVLPIVELVGGSATSQTTLDRAADLMASLGQDVVRVKRAAPGFVLNRLQAALVEEALALVASGIADPDDVDRTVRSGLGLRWAFAGPFETMDLNASGGFAAYAKTLGPALAASAPGGPESSNWNGEAPSMVVNHRRKLLDINEIPTRQQWLVGRLRALRALKEEKNGIPGQETS
ncbi:3-hydroxyacyl-CoA dehydrogenase NAD-binding domain-containing protein [Mesorhizobium sp. YM1C-6-2]|uniref:3-hydroxyacyl-CoA dehydrogenase NAD-binding domain-containing protein n=1 Tax=Mesorhizobium sp. YM1C-6-2 TaxID=1827501 RepID=UPI001600A0E8|nr:3-hydroxyacyl-CoA dehydrogenase NAD-binding domain-containing protein [Mesorhizobium sp. YM1C-6-2]